jgi:hypothetical protein
LTTERKTEKKKELDKKENLPNSKKNGNCKRINSREGWKVAKWKEKKVKTMASWENCVSKRGKGKGE